VTNLVRRDLSETLSVVGSLAPNESATIRPEMSGLIRSINFDEGGVVKKGDLLVNIDDSELLAQRAQSQARHDLARLNLARAEILRATGSNTQADVDRARSEFAAAQADLALLQVRLDRTEVRAPFDGVTDARTISVGDNVGPSTVITTVSDLSRLKAEFQVPERFSTKVKAGSPFTVKSTMFDALRPVAGEVYFVSPVTDRRTRSTEVKGYLTNPPAALKAGMFVTIDLVLEVRHNTLTAPEGSILVDQRGPQVIVVRERPGGMVADFVPVHLGLRTRGLVEIAPVHGELDEQTQVVAAGVGSLVIFPGSRLEPRPMREHFRIE
jgi:membrane fusion protein (multidrug efflux system)